MSSDDAAARDAGTVRLVCPRCDQPSAFACEGGWGEATCPLCRDRFSSLVATVRAKNATTDKQRAARDYRVRVKYFDQEELVSFTAGVDDIEMRAGDRIAVVYRGDTPYVVQNLTLGITTRLKVVSSHMALAVASAAVVIAIVAVRALAAG